MGLSQCFNLQVLHYVEKPSTFVSTVVNAGAYLFTPDIFQHLGNVFQNNHANDLM
jgi:mannose-1-phosphate guanylyltransferase